MALINDKGIYQHRCMHCNEPACVSACPVKAMMKDPATGVVTYNRDTCIGCRYCIVGCPYGARSFNWRDPRQFLTEVNESFPTRTRGVVEKCTLCTERLRNGDIPRCVEACNERGTRAIVFGDLKDPDSRVAKLAAR